MSLNMHGTQYGLSQHNTILQGTEVDWLCNDKQSKYNVKCPGSRYVALP